MFFGAFYDFLTDFTEFGLMVFYVISFAAFVWYRYKSKDSGYSNKARERFRRTALCHGLSWPIYSGLRLAIIAVNFYPDPLAATCLVLLILTGTLLVTYNYFKVLLLNQEYNDTPEPSTEDAHPPPKGA